MTVLTGFTFTALFSDHALANSGLPTPVTESDRQDLARLGHLADNFQLRVSYFLALSTVEIVSLVLFSFKLSPPQWLLTLLKQIVSYLDVERQTVILQTGDEIFHVMFTITLAILVFFYLECLYTFYRLSETILAIVRIRRDYMAEERGSQ